MTKKKIQKNKKKIKFNNKCKKSQFIVLSFVFLVLLLVIINYGIIKNNYKSNYIQSYIYKNIINEVCETAKNSNGSYIDERLNKFKVNLSKYCDTHNCVCNLTIYKSPYAPTNLSKLNYTYYNFSLYYKCKNLILEKRFKC